MEYRTATYFHVQDRLPQLNSSTKYPSIPTYHELGDNGILKPSTTTTFDHLDSKVYITEKVDGTNSRIILFPDNTYFIGSRDELLYYSADLLYNPALDIVRTVKSIAEILNGKFANPAVVFGESYGGKIGSNARNYGSITGFRIFDIIYYQNIDALFAWLDKPVEKCASDRDAGKQPFLNCDELIDLTSQFTKFGINVVPSICDMNSELFPTSISETYTFLKKFSTTSLAGLDDTGKLISEGIVVRNFNRSKIVKIRHEDYARTLRVK